MCLHGRQHAFAGSCGPAPPDSPAASQLLRPSLLVHEWQGNGSVSERKSSYCKHPKTQSSLPPLNQKGSRITPGRAAVLLAGLSGFCLVVSQCNSAGPRMVPGLGHNRKDTIQLQMVSLWGEMSAGEGTLCAVENQATSHPFAAGVPSTHPHNLPTHGTAATEGLN